MSGLPPLSCRLLAGLPALAEMHANQDVNPEDMR